MGNNNRHYNVANKRTKMKILLGFYVGIILICIIEAYLTKTINDEENNY
tara:strand:- start:1559 stop:1705 length:147 start_codon:yes stop_codon:yes gene_type:complete